MQGTIQGVITRNFVSAVEFVVGGGSGWYAWEGRDRCAGFEMRFTVDRIGNVYGGNKNSAADAEQKEYRGTFKNGELDVEAVFESGQVIKYTGRVLAGMQWNGSVQVKLYSLLFLAIAPPNRRVPVDQVVTAGTNAAAFEPVGTQGTVGGGVSIRRADSPHTIPLGMPMRQYHIGGVDGGWFAWASTVAHARLCAHT